MTMMTRAILVGVALLLAAPLARAEKLTIGMFAPNAPFDSAEARYGFVSKLAQAIAKETGATVEAKAFAHTGDFEAAVKRGQLDLAVVDGVYLAERGAPWTVMAIASSGGQTAVPWALFAGEPTAVFDLKGKRLAFASTSSRDVQFQENALLDGELAHLFGARQVTPDVASAVAAVSLKRADCVFAPDSAGRSLRKVFDAGRVPNPALVALHPLSGDVAEKVRKGALANGGGGPYDGWRGGSAEAYRTLGARMAPKTRKPVMAEPDVVSIDDGEVLAAQPLDPALPDLRDQFWPPQGTP